MPRTHYTAWIYPFVFNALSIYLTHILTSLGLGEEANQFSLFLVVPYPFVYLAEMMCIAALLILLQRLVKLHPRWRLIIWYPTIMTFIDFLWDYYQVMLALQMLINTSF